MRIENDNTQDLNLDSAFDGAIALRDELFNPGMMQTDLFRKGGNEQDAEALFQGDLSDPFAAAATENARPARAEQDGGNDETNELPAPEEISPMAKEVPGYDPKGNDWETETREIKRPDGTTVHTSKGEIEDGVFNDTSFRKNVIVGADGKVLESTIKYGDAGKDMSFGEGGDKGYVKANGVKQATMVKTNDGGTLMVIQPTQTGLLTGAAGEWNAIRFDNKGNYLGVGLVDAADRKSWTNMGGKK